MSIDYDMFEEFKAHLAEKYTVYEIVELLKLTEWDILEMFTEKVLELRLDQ